MKGTKNKIPIVYHKSSPCMVEEEGQNASETSYSLEGDFFLMDILLVAVNCDCFSKVGSDDLLFFLVFLCQNESLTFPC